MFNTTRIDVFINGINVVKLGDFMFLDNTVGMWLAINVVWNDDAIDDFVAQLTAGRTWVGLNTIDIIQHHFSVMDPDDIPDDWPFTNSALDVSFIAI